MPTKIETHLSPEQFLEFCRRCAQLKGGARLRTIQALAEEFGISISLMAATSFRDGPLADYLAELKSKREMAEQVAAVAKSGLSLSDAAASVLSQKIFDQALTLDTADEAVLGKSNALSLALSRLRLGDQRAKKLEADLRLARERIGKYEREQTEWQEAREKVRSALEAAAAPAARKGISPETLKRAQEALKLL